jgi:hypothetical protein
VLDTLLVVAALETPPLEDASRRALPDDLWLYGENLTRFEKWSAFEAPGGGDGDYDFVGNRLRLGLRGDRPGFGLHVAGQFTRLWSLPDDAAGTVGTGPLYFAHAARPTSGHTGGREDTWDLYLKYLWLEARDVGGTGLSVRAGRMGYASGMEATTADDTLDWIKRARVSSRLISEYAWSHFERSFDGALVTWDHAPGRLSLAALRPTQGAFADDAGKRIDEIDVLAAAYTAKPGRWLPFGETQLFAYRYDDDRNVTTRPDNSGVASPRGQDVDVRTLGAHWVAAHPVGAGKADWLVWGAWQTGDWFDATHRAWAGTLELGYQRRDWPWQPWLRAGYLHGSGDRSPSERRHTTFFQMLPNARLYSFATVANLMNARDAFAQLLLDPGERTQVRFDVHRLWLAHEDDVWYAGSGPTLSTGPLTGWTVRPSGGDDELATSLELTLTHELSPLVGLHLFYARVLGDDVVHNLFADDDLDFFYAEMTLRF